MKKTFLYFLLPLIYLSACCPGGEDNEYKRVAVSLKESVPYQTGQTVKFLDSDGSTYTLNVDRELQEEYGEFNKCSGQTLEFLNIQLKNQSVSPFMRFGTNYTTDEQMTIEVQTKAFNGGGNYHIFHYFMNQDGSFQCGERFNYVYTCHPTFTIGNTEYTDVLEINQKELGNDEEQTILKLFYSQTKGVLQYEFLNGKTVTLSEI